MCGVDSRSRRSYRHGREDRGSPTLGHQGWLLGDWMSKPPRIHATGKNTNGSLVTNLSSRTTYSLQPVDTHHHLGCEGGLIMGLTYNTGNLVPDRELATLPDPHNDTKTSSSHNLTKLNRRGVGPLAIVQPRPHGGVERNPCHLDQDLTKPDLQIAGRLRLALECGRSDVLRGAFVEDVLFVGRGQRHGERSWRFSGISGCPFHQRSYLYPAAPGYAPETGENVVILFCPETGSAVSPMGD